jgi:hypothetical protein
VTHLRSLIVSLALLGMAAPAIAAPAKVVKATEFQVVDSTGKVRATIGMGSHDAPEMRLVGKNGKSRLTVQLDGSDNPRIALNDPDGKTALIDLSYQAEQGMSPSLVIRDADGKAMLTLAINPLNQPRIIAEEGTGSVAVGTTAGKPYLLLVQPDGRTTWEAPSGTAKQ